MIDYPNKLNIIFDKLDYFNIKPIIIGGYVRDFLLDISSKDIDIELYGIESYEKLENILEEFGTVNRVGKSFGVCKLQFDDLDLDFSLPRTDNKIAQGHRGFKVITNKTLDFQTATKRRDFTINAIGYDVIKKKILDPFHGIKDLENGVLSAVDITKFDEDPLRVLRAVQFSARFHFKLDSVLFTKCSNMIKSGVLNELPSERILEEIKKLLLKSKKPSKGILLLKKLHGFLYFNELSTLNYTEFTHILKSLDYLANEYTLEEKKMLTLHLSILSFYLSKAARFHFIKKLSSEKKLIANINKLIDNTKDLNLDNLSNFSIFLLATKVNIEELSLFLKALFLDKKNDEIKELCKRAKELGVFTNPLTPLLQGKDLLQLNLQASKKFSEILDKAYILQMKEKFKTYPEALLWLKEELQLT
jgi:tRNA nucleotidyltransferase (CCA-adding enzyme)